ncbi:MAG: aminoacetone oxidase family FAD-binding enzyme [Planctomycetaceae bacterium TMED240]|nr:aminoacetone oxidase family FAD-binding enzyme [Rhodopirellula sp.]OUX05674.1 MAG: aminoacetone oxidase family FAD-binding enzyme [Planctomycetaceae bacterium TMED240]
MHVVVIGAGAAGMMAAYAAASQHATVILLEKNNKTGVKILMSGGTRCNLTHHTDARGIADAFGHAKRFLQPSLGGFPPQAVVDFFEAAGVATKIESTGKVFPVSNRAVQVRDALHGYAVDAGVEIRTGCGVTGIRPDGKRWMVDTGRAVIPTDRVIVTTGGKSWPGCGTTGDAYAWMTELGHAVERTRPALVPLLGGEQWMKDLSGLVVDDSIVTVLPVAGKQKSLARRRGSLLFTHFGFSGPAAMDVSGAITAATSLDQVRMIADLVPQSAEEELQAAFSNGRDSGKTRVSSLLATWLPNRLANGIVARLGQDARLAELSKKSRNRLTNDLKRMPLPVRGTRGFEKAEVTAGGVRLDQVNPRTLESRIHKGLFIAGELLDVDGPIGGYNFQAAFSTGRAAGLSASV